MNKSIRFLFILTFCSLVTATAQEEMSQASQLIVYFPVSHGSSLTGEVDSVTHASGNTQSIVRIIQRLTGADIFEIDLVSPYSSSYNTVLSEAKDDQRNRARPGIRNTVKNIDRYDVVFLGYPNWWASIPMPIATFLESYDLKGKKIIPFCTHGGGRLGQSISAIGKSSPSSEILTPLAVHYGGGARLERNVKNWLQENGVIPK